MTDAGRNDAPVSRGQWLRQQRQSRGWSVPEMRRHLREAAKEVGDTLPGNECLGVMIRRWEKDDGGGISERYRLHYCRVFKISFGEFGTAPAGLPPAAGDAVPAAQAGEAASRPKAAAPSQPAPPVPASGVPAGSEPGLRGEAPAGVPLASQVLLTARRGGEHAVRAERRDIGMATLEHLRCEVTRLSREYMTGEPLPLFFGMRRVRKQLYAALALRLWPRDQAEVYFLLGALTALMADAADAVGSPAAAEELARAGLAYAVAVDHRPLAARLRLSLAAVALRAGHFRRCLDMAGSGLQYLAAGPNGAQLHLMTARAAARLGDQDTALAAMSAAARARDMTHTDDVLGIGGQFSVSRACHHYLAGAAAADLPDARSEGLAQLSQAVELYIAGPEPGEDHSEHCKMAARADLAAAWLHAGDLGAAVTTVGPVLALPPGRRVSSLPGRLTRLRADLSASRYRGTPEARDLDEQIEHFCRDTIATRLTQAASAG